MNSVLLQSSTFVQITETTNQLTRTASTLTAEKCYQLALALYSLTEKVSFEDVQTAAKQLTQCASNIRTVGDEFSLTNQMDLSIVGYQWCFAKSNDCSGFGFISCKYDTNRL